MSLTTGRAPFSETPAGRFVPTLSPARHVAYVEPLLRRVRGVLDGRKVVDSERTVLVHRTGRPPEYAFPQADVLDSVTATPEPLAAGYVHVPWEAVDAWYEEEERVLGHPKNPYHRVDCVKARRHLQVEVSGVVLVDTSDVVGVYETSRAPQLYVPRGVVAMDRLVTSPTRTHCPYKGYATHWSAVIADQVVADVAWSYDEPLPECLPIAGMLSFYPERATILQDVPSWFAAPHAAAAADEETEDNPAHGQESR